MTDTRWDELAALDGLISRETGVALALLARDVSPHLAIVEIGTRRGKSACFLAEGARGGKGAHVWSIDAWDLKGNADGWLHHASPQNRTVFYAQVARLGLTHHITQLNDFSVRIAQSWTGPQIGLFFVDGDHAYVSVRADFQAWSKHFTHGTVVAFDDYGAKNSGVKQFVTERFSKERVSFPTPTLAVVTVGVA